METSNGCNFLEKDRHEPVPKPFESWNSRLKDGLGTGFPRFVLRKLWTKVVNAIICRNIFRKMLDFFGPDYVFFNFKITEN